MQQFFFSILRKSEIKYLEEKKLDSDTDLNLDDERMNSLPNDLLMRIFSSFTIKELCVLSRVCRKWNYVAQMQVQFAHLNTEKLNLLGTVGNNMLFSCILNRLHKLKYLSLDFCTKISDQTFTLQRINCPLEELCLSNLHITDASLESLIQVKETLRKLVIKNCKHLANIAIAQCLDKLPKLEFFDVRNTCADNLILKTALSFCSRRKIYLLCHNTNIDVLQFLKEFQNTEKEFLNASDVLFKHRNLCFEYSIECI